MKGSRGIIDVIVDLPCRTPLQATSESPSSWSSSLRGGRERAPIDPRSDSYRPGTGTNSLIPGSLPIPIPDRSGNGRRHVEKLAGLATRSKRPNVTESSIADGSSSSNDQPVVRLIRTDRPFLSRAAGRTRRCPFRRFHVIWHSVTSGHESRSSVPKAVGILPTSAGL